MMRKRRESRWSGPAANVVLPSREKPSSPLTDVGEGWKGFLLFLVAALVLNAYANAGDNLLQRLLPNDWARLGISTLVLAGIAWLLLQQSQIQALLGRLRPAPPRDGIIIDAGPVPTKKVLVVLISTNPEGSEFTAINYHLGIRKGRQPAAYRHYRRLEHCWMIHSSQSESLARTRSENYLNPDPKSPYDSLKCELKLMTDSASVIAASKAVNDVLNDITSYKDKEDENVGPWPLTDVIVDITGGTKIMGLGAVLACMERGVEMQYVNQATHEVMKVDIKPKDSTNTGASDRGATGSVEPLLLIQQAEGSQPTPTAPAQ